MSHFQKEDYLKKKVSPVDVTAIQNIDNLLTSLTTEYDGGLSGSTFSEARSWGKYDVESKHVSVWCDATIALPILISGLFQRLKII